MIFQKHSELKGKHAVLNPSGSGTWTNYSSEKMIERVVNSYAADIGTKLHELASKRIDARMKMKKTSIDNTIFYLIDHNIPSYILDYYDLSLIHDNLSKYVNDGISFNLIPEQPLYYSDFAFGTADAIQYDKGVLRISDLKTGKTPVHIEQLLDYAALFYLEYGPVMKIKPEETKNELRFYQNGEVIFHEPTAEEIRNMMNQNVERTKDLIHLREGY